MSLHLRPDARSTLRRVSARQLSSPASKADPFPFYADLRDHAPVCRMTLPFGPSAWLIARYEDVEMVLHDERFVKDPLHTMSPFRAARRRWIRQVLNPFQWSLLDLDGAHHTQLRSLANQAFTPRRIEALRERVTALTNGLIDRVERQGRMDVIQNYALQLPTTIIAEMLGVPLEDQTKFHRWSDSLIATGSSLSGMAQTMRVAWVFRRYIRRLITQRRRYRANDFISEMLQHQTAVRPLSDRDLTSLLFLLLVAGHETTINLIGNGVVALLQHPDQLERLRREPDLVKPAVEEILRFTSPFEIATKRFAREPVVVQNVTIRRGERVFALIASANRDERHFADPDQFDIAREPNRHLSFGLGAHFCLGATLARLEGQIALSTLLNRLPEFHLDVASDQLRWRRTLIMRGLESLPIAWPTR